LPDLLVKFWPIKADYKILSGPCDQLVWRIIPPTSRPGFHSFFVVKKAKSSLTFGHKTAKLLVFSVFGPDTPENGELVYPELACGEHCRTVEGVEPIGNF